MSERPVEKAVDWVEVTRPRLVGFAPHIGITIDTLEPGHGTGHCDLTPEHFNPYGFAHGGAINALMDTVGGFTASVAHGELRYVVTRSADVHYVRPLMGSRMDVRCEGIKAGKQTCKQAGRQNCGKAGKQICRQSGRKTCKQAREQGDDGREAEGP